MLAITNATEFMMSLDRYAIQTVNRCYWLNYGIDREFHASYSLRALGLSEGGQIR